MSKKMKHSFVLTAITGAILLLAGCGEKASVPASAPVATVAAITSAPRISAPASDPIVQAPVAVVPAVFAASTAASGVADRAPTPPELLLREALLAGLNSDVGAVPASMFKNTASKFIDLAADIRNGNPDASLEKLSSKPWTKPMAYLVVGKRTILFSVLVSYPESSSSKSHRGLMNVVASIDESGKAIVASLQDIHGAPASDIYVVSLESDPTTIYLDSAQGDQLRPVIAAALK